MIKNISIAIASIAMIVAFASCGAPKYDLSGVKKAAEAFAKGSTDYKAAVEAAADAPALVKAIKDFTAVTVAFAKVGVEEQKKMAEFAAKNKDYKPSADDMKSQEEIGKVVASATEAQVAASTALAAKAFASDATVLQAMADMGKAAMEASGQPAPSEAPVASEAPAASESPAAKN